VVSDGARASTSERAAERNHKDRGKGKHGKHHGKGKHKGGYRR
jgi:hypothetical protein